MYQHYIFTHAIEDVKGTAFTPLFKNITALLITILNESINNDCIYLTHYIQAPNEIEPILLVAWTNQRFFAVIPYKK